MNIVWQYLDKRAAAINALKDYSSMKYIIEPVSYTHLNSQGLWKVRALV